MENLPSPQVKEGLHPWFRRDGGGMVAVPFYSVQGGCRFDIHFAYFVVFFRDYRASELRKRAWKSPAIMKLTRCHFFRGWRYRARALTLRGLISALRLLQFSSHIRNKVFSIVIKAIWRVSSLTWANGGLLFHFFSVQDSVGLKETWNRLSRRKNLPLRGKARKY